MCMQQPVRSARQIYRPEKRSLAVLLIDLQKAHRHEFSYEHGTVEDGLRRTVAVMTEARALCIPVLLITGENTPDLVPEISAVASGALLFKKRTASAFWIPELSGFLNDALRRDTLVVGGWARHICVRETVLDALAEGYNIMTSDQIIFGKPPSSDPILTEIELRGFRDQLRIYPTSDDLIQAMRREIAKFC